MNTSTLLDCGCDEMLKLHVHIGDVKFCIQIGSDWPQIGHIWDFLRSVSVHFGAGRQNVLKLILKSPRYVPFGANLTQFGYQI